MPHNICGPLAQLAEHLTFNQGVPRSSRGWITIFKALSTSDNAVFGAFIFHMLTFQGVNSHFMPKTFFGFFF